MEVTEATVLILLSAFEFKAQIVQHLEYIPHTYLSLHILLRVLTTCTKMSKCSPAISGIYDLLIRNLNG